MNKKKIDGYIPKAYEALTEFKIAEEVKPKSTDETREEKTEIKINKTFRGCISSFGAAIVMGSLCSAIAFNSQQKSASVEREKLMKAIYYIITDAAKEDKDNIKNDTLLKFVLENKNREAEIKEKVYNAAIALKLAMNMYDNY